MSCFVQQGEQEDQQNTLYDKQRERQPSSLQQQGRVDQQCADMTSQGYQAFKIAFPRQSRFLFGRKRCQKLFMIDHKACKCLFDKEQLGSLNTIALFIFAAY